MEDSIVRRGLIRRPRLELLLDSLDAICVLNAPAGFGKTVLIRQWVETTAARVVWLDCSTIREDAASIADSLADTLECVSQLGPDPPMQRPGGLTTLTLRDPTLVKTLASEMTNAPKVHCLVLDAYQSAIGRELERLIANVMVLPGLRVLVTTRSLPRWASARRAIYGEVHVIGLDDLRMTREESAAVFAMQGRPATEEQFAATDGWPAFVNMLALNPTLRLRHGAALRHFIGDEVCRGFDPHGLELLTLLAALPPTSADDFIELTASSSAATTVAAGLQRSLLIESEAGLIAPHAVMNRYLLDLTRQTRRSLAIETVLRRVVVRLVRAGRWDDAFGVVSRFRHHSLFAFLARRGIPKLVAVNDMSSVRLWVRFGRDEGVSITALDWAEAEIALREGMYTRAEALAVAVIGQSTKPKRLALAAHLTAARAAHLGGREDRALTHYQLARSTRESGDVALWGELAAAIDLELPSATLLLDELRRDGWGDPEHLVRWASSRLLLGMRQGALGEIARERDVETLVDIVQNPFVRTAFRSVYGYAAAITGDYALARKQAHMLRNDGRDSDMQFVAPYAALIESVVCGATRGFAECFRLLDEACDGADGNDTFVLASASAIRARALIGLGHYSDAAAFASYQRQPLTRSMQGELFATKSLALACAGDFEEAREYGQRARTCSRTVEVAFLSNASDVICALSEGHNNGGANLAVAELTRQARELGYVDGLIVVARGCPRVARRMAVSADHEWLVRIFTNSGDTQLMRLSGFGSSDASDKPGLSPREAEVLELLHEGLTNMQIASRLFIAPSTVKVHAHRIYEKLGVRNRTEAALALAMTSHATSATEPVE